MNDGEDVAALVEEHGEPRQDGDRGDERVACHDGSRATVAGAVGDGGSARST